MESSRAIVIERLNVTASLDPYMGLKALAVYSGLSVRKLRQLIDRDPANALPCGQENGPAKGAGPARATESLHPPAAAASAGSSGRAPSLS